jgi:hypothetical protein
MEGLIMRTHRPSSFLLLAIGASLLGPPLLLAQDNSLTPEPASDPGILSGLTGLATARGQDHASEPRPLKFRDPIASGDEIATEAATTADILWGNATLLTLFEQSSIHITTTQLGHTLVRLTAGTVRVAVAASEIGPDGAVIVQTPTAKVVTRGGVLQASTTSVTRIGSSDDLQPEPLIHYVSQISPSQTVAAAASASETIQVLDGQAEVMTEGTIPGRQSIGKGQEVLLEGGRVIERTPDRQSPERLVLLAAVSPHALTPQESTLKLVNDQQAVAAQLGRALTGEKEESEGVTEQNTKGAIISTTLGFGGSASINLPGFFGSAPGISPPGTGVVDPPGDAIPGTFVFGASQLKLPSLNVQGGGGLLLLNNSIIGGQEFVMIDGGKIETDFSKFPTINWTVPHPSQNRAQEVTAYKAAAAVYGTASHNGVEPSDRLLLSDFNGGNQALIPRVLATFSPSNNSSAAGATSAKIFRPPHLGAVQALAQYGTNPAYDPSEFSRPRFEADKLFLGVSSGFTSANFPTSGIDAVIRGRSASDTALPVFSNSADQIIDAGRIVADRTVVLKGGVVLYESTINISPTNFTQKFENELNGITSSIAGLIGRDETGIEAGNHPAFVRMQDRMLAVLNGSAVAPATPDTRLSLLTILDSELRGPTEPPDLFPGDPQPEGVPNGKARADVPPLIEAIDSRSSFADPNFAVVAQSAITMRASSQLDQALLEASAPLVSLINSTMRTNGDFAHISGAKAQLTANVPNDQLVLRGAVQLNGSTLSVGGHLFNLTDGARASLTGNLVALANGSTLNIGQALINVGPGSNFTLSGGSLVSFGIGTNNVNIGGATCPGCVPRTNIPNLTAGIPIMAHPTAAITVQPGFMPFAGVGTGTTTSGQTFRNTVTLPQGNLGALVVGPNATLALSH